MVSNEDENVAMLSRYYSYILKMCEIATIFLSYVAARISTESNFAA